jgi:hypothetical protein
MAPGSVVPPIVQRRPGRAGAHEHVVLTFVASGTAPDREPMTNRLTEPPRILVA